ncbi:hypothetical protein CFRS1_v005546 [Colletotrichum fructicola]|nr:hypothetical protein CFRS1_v005546 [Colletotrichum fructicola]
MRKQADDGRNIAPPCLGSSCLSQRHYHGCVMTPDAALSIMPSYAIFSRLFPPTPNTDCIRHLSAFSYQNY